MCQGPNIYTMAGRCRNALEIGPRPPRTHAPFLTSTPCSTTSRRLPPPSEATSTLYYAMPTPPSNSSAASQSPPMAFLPLAAATPESVSSGADHDETEERRKAVQKFMARAEISMVTRGLRTRLSYAAYKANHNVPHLPLNDLEAQSQAHFANIASSRTLPAKRKVGGGNYYNNPATQGGASSSSTITSLKRVSSGSMAPPSFTLAPRTYYPNVDGGPSTTDSTKPPGSTMNLYTSILAPPPSKQARTIFNAGDPPVAAPTRSPPTPRSGPNGKAASSKSVAEGTRGHARGRNAPSTPGRSKRAAKKGKTKQKSGKGEDTMDADVEAAATLTSIFMAHRGSIGSAGSPRSSVDGGTSETGESQNTTHPPGSATPRMVRPASVAATRPLQGDSSSATLVEPSGSQSKTPPPGETVSRGSATPLLPATDNEAADLMLYLATSPSPARPANKDSKDAAAFRALSGGTATLRNKGRILFPSGPPGTDQERPGGGMPKAPGPSALSRGSESSFNATRSPSIGNRLGAPQPAAMDVDEAPRPVAPSAPTPSQLLPPPPLASSPALAAANTQPSRPSSAMARNTPSSPRPQVPEFNIHEFINATPSPHRGTPVGLGTPGRTSNLGLRADVGRKLFEEEQIRMSQGKIPQPSPERSLGASIDLVQG